MPQAHAREKIAYTAAEQESVRRDTARILKRPCFKSSERCTRLLTYLVNGGLARPDNHLKERISATNCLATTWTMKPALTRSCATRAIAAAPFWVLVLGVQRDVLISLAKVQPQNVPLQMPEPDSPSWTA